jgi:exopolyphosphatase/guanosine-5'-triphosphate,3'-diphosphate pyrophosphatase
VERTLAVVDMGSNSFRLVVYRYVPGGWFRLVDEIREPVRLSERTQDGRLRRRALARAERASRLYGAYCASAGIAAVDAVATSAVRDAVNRDDAMAALRAGGLPVRVLSAEEEARYGYLAVVNGTTLHDGWFMDIGGGSLQVGRVAGRRLAHAASRPLGAVRLTEAFLRGDQRDRSEIAALRKHVRRALAGVDWLREDGGRLVGIGGAVRTLAVMQQRRVRHPFINPDGHRLTREGLGMLIDALVALPVDQRAKLPGLRPDRADIILAAALAIDETMAAVGTPALEISSQGVREGVFLEHMLAPADPPLLPDVRAASVRNAAERFGWDREHSEQVARVALAAFDGTAGLGLHAGDPWERELLEAAAALHDTGVLVDYSAHQRHSEYLVLNASMPGFDHREIALIGALVRGHRKGVASLEPYAGLLRAGDEERYWRMVSVLRLAEQLERAKAGEVREVRVRDDGGTLEFAVACAGDPSLALWSGERELPHLERAFGRPVRLAPAAGVLSPPRG